MLLRFAEFLSMKLKLSIDLLFSAIYFKE